VEVQVLSSAPFFHTELLVRLKFVRRIATTSLSIFFIVIAALSNAQAEDRTVNSSNLKQEGFIDLFHEQGTGFAVISNDAENFIMSCCKEREKAISLLKQNGFQINSVNSKEKIEKLNSHWKTKDENYNEFIFGKRGTGITRFWRLLTQYTVVLFIKEGSVERVYATVNTTYP